MTKSGQYARWADPYVDAGTDISLSLLAVPPLTHPKIKYTYFMAILTSGVINEQARSN